MFWALTLQGLKFVAISWEHSASLPPLQIVFPVVRIFFLNIMFIFSSFFFHLYRRRETKTLSSIISNAIMTQKKKLNIFLLAAQVAASARAALARAEWQSDSLPIFDSPLITFRLASLPFEI